MVGCRRYRQTPGMCAGRSEPIAAQATASKSPAMRYFLLSVLLWIVVDLGTAGGFRPAYLLRYGPALLVFYLGCPAMFTMLVFRFRLGGRALFAATVLEMLIVEVLFTGNPLLTSFPVLLVGLPLAVAVYLPLTFVPLWIVRREVRRRRRTVIVLAGIELLITALTTFGG